MANLILPYFCPISHFLHRSRLTWAPSSFASPALDSRKSSSQSVHKPTQTADAMDHPAALRKPEEPACLAETSSGFVVRLLTFYDKANEGVTMWPHTTPTPEDMAGAGFISFPTSIHADNVKCDHCNLQCFRWEAKDDPYDEHSKNSEACAFLKEEAFEKFHKTFRAKHPAGGAGTPPATPLDEVTTPKTPRRRRKMAMTKIQTVADLEPIAVHASPATPMRISISSAGVSMDLTVHGSGQIETPTKKRRYN